MAIAHQNGVVLCEQYEEKINRHLFSDFIKTHFEESFSWYRIPKGKRFLQDGCPAQNSKKAIQAPLDTVGAIKFSIPPHSPDFNPIEDVFDFVKSELRTEAFEKNINYETFEQFSARAKRWYIDKIIESMPNFVLYLKRSCFSLVLGLCLVI